MDFLNYFARTNNIFNSPVKDMDPTKVFRVDDGYVVVCKTIGIDKNDISIKVENDHNGSRYPILRITGATKIEKIDFENSVNLAFAINCREEVDKIDYTVKDGLTIIHLIVKKNDFTFNDKIQYNDDLTF
jgi:HSP20 family molecular chaperone IbpA